VAVHFHGDRTLEEGDTDDHPPGAQDLNQNAFEAAEGAPIDADPVADLEERPGGDGKAGGEHGVDGEDLAFRDGLRVLGAAHDGEEAGGGLEAEAVLEGEAAEDVTGEERELDLLEANGPALAGTVQRQVLHEALIPQGHGGDLFVARFDAEGIPGQ
jgi:hypothetical protein